jgi:hypothetical protein
VARCHAETKEIIMLTTDEVYEARETTIDRDELYNEYQGLMASRTALTRIVDYDQHRAHTLREARIAWLEIALDIVPF